MGEIVTRRQSAYPPPGDLRLSPGAGETREDTVNLQRIVTALARRKLQIVIVTLLIVIPAAVATYLTSPLFRSSALIQMNPDAVQILPYRDVVEPAGGVYYETYMKTQEQVLRSPTLASRVAQQISSGQDRSCAQELPWLGERFSVQRIENSQIFRISYLGSTPDTAAQVVNTFAEEYIKQSFDSRQKTRQRAREALKRELQTLDGRVQLSEKELVRYAQQQNILAVDAASGDPIQKKLGTLDQQVTDSETDVAVAKSRLQALQDLPIKAFPERLATPVIASLNSRLLQAEGELSTMLATFGEKWPAVVQKREEIRLIREQLDREQSTALARASQQAELDFEAARKKHGIVADALKKQKELVHRHHEASIQYNLLRREVDTNQKLYEGLLERLKQTGVVAGTEFGNIQIIEPGRPSKWPDRPKILWNVALSSLLGLAFGVCIAFVRDFWDESIATLDDAEQLAGLPVLGSVPSSKALVVPRSKQGAKRLPETTSLSLVRSSPPSPPQVAEAIRAVCASILLSQSDTQLRLIAVTSAEPAEGKTLLVTEIGRALAESGAPTLLVETDLRKPDLSEVFGVSNKEGLSLFLSGQVSPAPKIHQTPHSNLFLITAGPKPPNPLSMLNSEKLYGFLQQMASPFRFVLLDAPPLLAVADSRLLSNIADGVVLVVRAKRTPRKLVLRAWSLLRSSGANALGIVLNGVNPRDGSAYYRYYSPK